MVGFILTGHGEFAQGMMSVIELLGGAPEDFAVVPFDVNEAGEYPELIQGKIAEMSETYDGVLVFVDLIGGTPFNQAMIASQLHPNVSVVGGTNVPMLIETIFSRNMNKDATADELAEMAVQSGINGVAHKTTSSLSNDEDE